MTIAINLLAAIALTMLIVLAVRHHRYGGDQ